MRFGMRAYPWLSSPDLAATGNPLGQGGREAMHRNLVQGRTILLPLIPCIILMCLLYIADVGAGAVGAGHICT